MSTSEPEYKPPTVEASLDSIAESLASISSSLEEMCDMLQSVIGVTSSAYAPVSFLRALDIGREG